jgi:hypothetical protein
MAKPTTSKNLLRNAVTTWINNCVAGSPEKQSLANCQKYASIFKNGVTFRFKFYGICLQPATSAALGTFLEMAGFSSFGFRDKHRDSIGRLLHSTTIHATYFTNGKRTPSDALEAAVKNFPRYSPPLEVLESKTTKPKSRKAAAKSAYPLGEELPASTLTLCEVLASHAKRRAVAYGEELPPAAPRLSGLLRVASAISGADDESKPNDDRDITDLDVDDAVIKFSKALNEFDASLAALDKAYAAHKRCADGAFLVVTRSMLMEALDRYNAARLSGAVSFAHDHLRD